MNYFHRSSPVVREIKVWGMVVCLQQTISPHLQGCQTCLDEYFSKQMKLDVSIIAASS
jgi:hypothetical protein